MNQQPMHTFRAGAVSCAVWQNEIQRNGESQKICKANIERRYRDKDGRWQSSTSFARNDIPLAIHCLQQAFEAMIEDDNADT
jgi:hypothetical protein